MRSIIHGPLLGRSVWKRDDAQLVCGVTSSISRVEAIDDGSSGDSQLARTIDQNTPGRTPRILATFSEVLDHIHFELMTGCGFALVYDRGLNHMNLETLKQRYFELGCQLGTLVPQSADG